MDIPATQLRMGRKYLERLVWKLHYTHLIVLGAVAHLFHIPCMMNQRRVDWVWISMAFHCDLADWKALALQAASRLTHLAKIDLWEPTHLGFCDASGLGA